MKSVKFLLNSCTLGGFVNNSWKSIVWTWQLSICQSHGSILCLKWQQWFSDICQSNSFMGHNNDPWTNCMGGVWKYKNGMCSFFVVHQTALRDCNSLGSQFWLLWMFKGEIQWITFKSMKLHSTRWVDKSSRVHFNMKTLSCQYRNSHYKGKTISSSYLYNMNIYTWKDSLYIEPGPKTLKATWELCQPVCYALVTVQRVGKQRSPLVP